MAGHLETPQGIGVPRTWLSAGRSACLALLGLALQGGALAQAPGNETVSWTVSVQSPEAVKPGGRLTLVVHGAVLDGWHVYGLEQLPDGPTPLRVTLDSGEVAVADGAPTGSAPTKFHDPSFKLDTQFYTREFTVTAPARIGANVAPGPRQVPVSVRFQTCNGPTCRPPTTAHLTALVNVQKAG